MARDEIICQKKTLKRLWYLFKMGYHFAASEVPPCA